MALNFSASNFNGCSHSVADTNFPLQFQAVICGSALHLIHVNASRCTYFAVYAQKETKMAVIRQNNKYNFKMIHAVWLEVALWMYDLRVWVGVSGECVSRAYGHDNPSMTHKHTSSSVTFADHCLPNPKLNLDQTLTTDQHFPNG